MRIEIHSAFLQGAPVEIHDWAGNSYASFLDAKGFAWRDKDHHPVVTVNGYDWPVELWESPLDKDAVVRVTVIPEGGIFKSIGSIIGKIFNAVFGWLVPKSKNATAGSPEQGEKLETVNSKANQAKLGSVVPETLGRHVRYVDYLTPPHRFFENMRTQRVQFFACVGPGLYSVNDNDVKIGDTPFNQLDGCNYYLYPPGADVAGDISSEHWHETTEVGGTSSGTPGLTLSTDAANRQNVDPPEYTFNWDTVTRTDGSEFPPGWGVGTIVRVELPLPYDVVTINVPPTEFDPGYQISEITGWLHHYPNPRLVEGQTIGLGPFGAVVNYRIREIEPTATLGYYTFRLETIGGGTDGDPVLLPPGTGQILRFGSELDRTIYAVDSVSAFGLTPGRFATDGSPLIVAGAKVAYQGGEAYGEWTNEYVATPGNEKTWTIEFDVFFQNGLALIEDDGELTPQTVNVQLQYRNLDTGVRTTVNRTYTQATLDQIGFTERIDLPEEMRVACRMRRISPKSTKTNINDACVWYGLKVRLWVKTLYPNWTTMGVHIRSGGVLAAQSENQVNLVCTRNLPQLNPDNTWTGPQETRQISAAVKYVLTTIGYTDDQIDMEALQALHNIWFTRNDFFDYSFDSTTVREALQLIVEAGMGEITISEGKVRVVREDVRTVFEQAYSPQNMTGTLQRTFTAKKPDDSDGVEVEYMDPTTWTKAVVRCGLPGDAFTKIESMRADGVTDRTRAWRIGMRRRRMLKYRRWKYSFGTELSALNSEYKSYCPLFDDVPGYGQSAILLKVTDMGGGLVKFRVSEELRWEEGANHSLGYRATDGRFMGPYTAERGDDNYEVVANVPLPWPVVTLRMEPIHVFFGVVEYFCFPALLDSIAPQGSSAVSVTAVNYDARVYADDNNSPA